MADFERIGKYQIVGEIGEGAMGVVYKAHDPILNRYVAIKMISASLKADNELRERFLREAQAAASLAHRNIITIYDFGEDHDRIYMAMELLVGTDLKELIGSPTLRRLEDKLGVMEQICDGMAFAHARGVVHRDIKPGNIHIQPNGEVKILDFGLARLGSSDMTKTGLVMGTPNYMSPEQVMGERVDARSDVFSCGAVFYELLCNHKPFEADSVHGVMFRVVHKEHPSLKGYQPSLPPIMIQVVDRALNKERAERFQHAGELREALSQVRKAVEKGRGHDATLVVEDVEIVDTDDMEVAEIGDETAAGGPAAALVEGTVALDPARAQPAKADRTKKPGSTKPGGTQAPIAAAPPPEPVRSGAPVAAIAGGIALVAALGAGAWFFTRPQPQPVAPSTAGTGQVDVLKEALVSTQVELAQRDLQDKDYAGAIAQAERVLKLDPANAEAKGIVDEAKKVQSQVEAAAEEARVALAGGDTAKAADALTRILGLDPKHPSASQLTSQLNRFFKGQAEESRTAMAKSRTEADGASAGSSPAYQQASSLSRDGETALARGEFAVATRNFLEARDGFDKAKRTVVAQAKTPTRPGLPTAPPVSTAAQPTAPPMTLAVETPPPTMASAPETTAPAASNRNFVPSRTTVLGQSARGGPAGFDTGGLEVRQEATELAGAISFDMSPQPPGAGQPFTVRVTLKNLGKKNVKVKAVRAMTIIDGSRQMLVPKVAPVEIKPREAASVGEVSGSWPSAPGSWILDVVVVGDKAEYKSQLVWR